MTAPDKVPERTCIAGKNCSVDIPRPAHGVRSRCSKKEWCSKLIGLPFVLQENHCKRSLLDEGRVDDAGCLAGALLGLSATPRALGNAVLRRAHPDPDRRSVFVRPLGLTVLPPLTQSASSAF